MQCCIMLCNILQHPITLHNVVGCLAAKFDWLINNRCCMSPTTTCAMLYHVVQHLTTSCSIVGSCSMPCNKVRMIDKYYMVSPTTTCPMLYHVVQHPTTWFDVVRCCRIRRVAGGFWTCSKQPWPPKIIWEDNCKHFCHVKFSANDHRNCLISYW